MQKEKEREREREREREVVCVNERAYHHPPSRYLEGKASLEKRLYLFNPSQLRFPAPLFSPFPLADDYVDRPREHFQSDIFFNFQTSV